MNKVSQILQYAWSLLYFRIGICLLLFALVVFITLTIAEKQAQKKMAANNVLKDDDEDDDE